MPFTLQNLKDSIPFSNMATTDRQMLLFCISLAFVFWLVLNLSQDYEIDKTVNLEYVTIPQRAIAGDPPRTVPVRIAGSGWSLLLESLQGSEMDVTIEIPGTEALQLNGNVLRQAIGRRLSSGDLEIESMNYESQRVITTPKNGKRVPVVSRIAVDYTAGYSSISSLVIQPDTVTVSGAIDDLDTIFNWPTVDLELSGVMDDVRTAVSLQKPPEGLTLSHEDVDISLEVEPFIERKFRIPVNLYNAPEADSSQVFPSHVMVTATIPRRRYGQIRQSDFRVEADLSRMENSNGQNTVPLRLTRQPENIRNVDFTPKAIEYYVYTRLQ